MKRAITFLLFFVFLSLFFSSTTVFAQNSWTIQDFHSDILIPKGGKVRVVETIEVDFGLLQKHGIYRTIPTEGIKFRLLGVWQDGEKATTDISSSGGEFSIRIGDPDRTISGEHTYEISYEVGKVITRFDDHDEFYWNVTGSDWEVPILSASASVSLEGGDVQQVVCFTGGLGSQAQSCSAEVSAAKGEFATSGELYFGEGLTIANAFPKGLVDDPFYLDDLARPIWLIFGSLAAVLLVVRRWLKHGRDLWYRNRVILNPNAPQEVKPLFAKHTVVVEFDPPTREASGGKSSWLRPGEVGTLIDERVDVSDISATIVDLAVRGYLKIIEVKKGRSASYTFERQKDFEGDVHLQEWEKAILRGIFGESKEKVALDDLKEKFYLKLKGIRDELYTRLTAEKYFPQRPDKVMLRYLIAGGALAGISVVLVFALSEIGLWWVPVPPAVLGVLLLIAASLMPRKTAQGTEAVRRASGFKLFISTAQKYMQHFNERVNYFDQFLPYAMVFGVVDKWIGVFKELGIEPARPTWYVGPEPFNFVNFSSTVHAMDRSFASTLPSQPASHGGSGFGGGGFSGGGFGGGGGGSW